MFPFGVNVILFVLGLAFGSFFNVLTMRYDGERTLGDPDVIGGRSHCPFCHRELSWIELIPVVSFLVQGAKCRHCHKHISWAYPVVELITAFIFVFVPLQAAIIYGATGAPLLLLQTLWIVAFSCFLIMTLIDLRLGIIPDELTIFLVLLGIGTTVIANNSVHIEGSFFGQYAAYFGIHTPFWWNHVFGAIFGGVFLGALWLVTRGKGMGMGDVKFAVPLGLLFGWPDVLFLVVFAFVIGAVVGVIAILLKRKTMASSVPFGPFLAVASAIVFFWGVPMMTWYFHTLGL